MVIRSFYSEWGYYLTCKNKSLFVSSVPLLGNSKFHKYVFSFLDIVALCRAISLNDKINQENTICVISSDLNELFKKYTNYENEKKWGMILPLWVVSLFEFYATGAINEDVKATLLKSLNEDTKYEISIFLQSFWVDMERREFDKEMSDYIYLFKQELLNQKN